MHGQVRIAGLLLLWLIILALPGYAQGTSSTTAAEEAAQQATRQQQLQQQQLQQQLTQASATQLAQIPPTTLPTDITPQAGSQEEKTIMAPDLRYKIFTKLPERMFFDFTGEFSQRLETNVFFTENKPRQDYVFRALPNVTLGYQFLKHTGIYCNYFVIKDNFADHTILSQPTTQSLALGFRRDFPIGRRSNLQLDFQSRELWQVKRLHQADLIPSLNFTHIVNPKMILFASTLLQMRGREYFCGPNREIDPFYTIGCLLRRGQWNFIATHTYVTNFRNKNAIPPISNQLMISDFELSRPVSKKVPGVMAFIRAEPVWNWGAHGAPGLSGFDFRLFGGIRIVFNKPALNESIDKLRDQLLESENENQQPKQSSHLDKSRKLISQTPTGGN